MVAIFTPCLPGPSSGPDVLAELHVRDLALVEDVWLEFPHGLTVLTGETGAGKTVLVEALKLLLGERADSTMVRQGASEAVVEGRFLADEGELLVRRRITSEGRSHCTIDGEMATVGMLAQRLGSLVDLHGQHAHQALLSPGLHVSYLDRFIGVAALDHRAAYRDARIRERAAATRLEELVSALSDRDRRSDYLRFVIKEIEAAAPLEGEDDELTARVPRLRHAERLAGVARAAFDALKSDSGASEALSMSQSSLGGVSGLDPVLDDIAAAIDRIDVELQEIAAALRGYAEDLEYDPAALEEVEARLHRLGDLKRKYGPALADVIRTAGDATRELALLDAGEAGLADARAEHERAAAALVGAAETLARVRAEAAEPFCEHLTHAAAELALPGAIFAVQRTPLARGQWTDDGSERIEFLFSSGPGEDPRPLAKIASGGEISRVMLALKGVLGSADSVPVLVFDEVDAGIGGATATAVGRRLAALAGSHQVLVVTHLAQVAAFADTHVVVRKEYGDGRTTTSAQLVSGDERTAEIARMLSGETSATALSHAAELLTSITAPAPEEG